MVLSKDLIGRERAGGTLLVTRSRLRMFAKATGQEDPVFTDVEAAKQAGHRDLPVPPTFYFGIDMEGPEGFSWLTDLGVDIRSVLHGEQELVYHQTAYAGDELTTAPVISDVYDKKGGALQFLVTDTDVVNQDGQKVVTMRNSLVIRQLPEASA